MQCARPPRPPPGKSAPQATRRMPQAASGARRVRSGALDGDRQDARKALALLPLHRKRVALDVGGDGTRETLRCQIERLGLCGANRSGGSRNNGRVEKRAPRPPPAPPRARRTPQASAPARRNGAPALARGTGRLGGRGGAWRRARRPTMTAMEVSGSCPMPVTTGTGQRAMVRARRSSLNGMRSSNDPPPRTTSTTSAPASTTCRMPSTMPAGACAPSTGTPAKSTRESGKRRRSVRSNVVHGRPARRRDQAHCARVRRQRPLSRRIHEPFGLQLAREIGHFQAQVALPGQRQRKHVEVHAPLRRVQRETPVSSTSWPTRSATPAAW